MKKFFTVIHLNSHRDLFRIVRKGKMTASGVRRLAKRYKLKLKVTPDIDLKKDVRYYHIESARKPR